MKRTARVTRGSMVRRGVAGLSAAVIAVFFSPVAEAGPDTTGPTISMQATGHLLVGSPVEHVRGSFADGTQVFETTVEARWSATDPSGVCDYQVWSDSGRDVPTFVADVGLATRYRLQSGDLDEADGGYNQTNLEIRARDCAGNWSVSGWNCTAPDCGYPTDWPFPPTDRALNRDDNVNYLYSHDDGDAAYAPAGAWTHSSCVCFVGGTVSHASRAGASATMTYTGQTFGWVSEYGPTRGSAEVYQDGVLRATVNLNAATATGPRVVWSNWFPTSATHTITVRVLGTAGHPRVDVDGFLTGPQWP